MKWIALKDADGKGGVRYREHETRKHGRQPDRYYALSYWWEGKSSMEGVGWASEGVKPTDCFDLLKTLKRNQKLRQGPCTLKEMRVEQDRKKRAEEDAIRAEEKRRVTLTQYFEQDYAPVAQTQKKATSWAKEVQHFKSWIGPLLGKECVADIDLPHWDDLVKSLSAAGLSVRTKEYVTGTLRRILKFAYERRVVSNPPPTGKRIGCTGPGNSNRRTRVITSAEEVAILDMLKDTDPWAERFVRFGFLTGARSSEISALKWGQVDFVRGVVQFVDTKNKDSRELPLSSAVLALLQSLPMGKPDEHVFGMSKGAPYTQAPSAYFTAVEKLGLNEGRTAHDRITFHSIRHTVATNLARVLSIRELMDVMGWRVMAMAARYIKSNDASMRSALEGLGQPRGEGAKVIAFTSS